MCGAPGTSPPTIGIICRGGYHSPAETAVREDTIFPYRCASHSPRIPPFGAPGTSPPTIGIICRGGYHSPAETAVREDTIFPYGRMSYSPRIPPFGAPGTSPPTYAREPVYPSVRAAYMQSRRCIYNRIMHSRRSPYLYRQIRGIPCADAPENDSLNTQRSSGIL